MNNRVFIGVILVFCALAGFDGVRAQTTQSAGRGTHQVIQNAASITPGLQYFDALGSAHAVTLDASLALNPTTYVLSVAAPATVKHPVIEVTTLTAGQTTWSTTLPVNQSALVRVVTGGSQMYAQVGDYTVTVATSGIVTIAINTSAQITYTGEVVSVEYTPL